LLWLAVRAQWRTVAAAGPASLAEALTLVIVAAAAVLGAWLLTSTAAAVLAHLPGTLGDAADQCARAWAPAVSRRLATLIVGAVLGTSLAPTTALADGVAGPPSAPHASSPAFTATAPSARPSTASAPIAPPVLTDAPPPAPGWTPSRPVQRPQPASGLVTGGGSSGRPGADADVVVHRGDTLWGIVRRHLGPGASDAEVAAAWPAWHRANRAVIGADPDLILPGQVLRKPGPVDSPSGQASGGWR
jgi:nucleoid-associated protein YgaU